MRNRILVSASVLLIVAAQADTDTVRANPAAGTAGGTADTPTLQQRHPAPATVTAIMRDAGGADLGTLTLEDGPGGITVSGVLNGLPEGTRAIHIHMVGRCEPPFESAGEHWNPTGNQHGTENPRGPHLGDLPNLMADADGMADYEGTTPGGSLTGANPVMDDDGAALVIHAGPDDYRTDPSGNSGARIACGVIGAG